MKKLVFLLLAVAAMIGTESCKSQQSDLTIDQVNYQLAGNWYFEKVGNTLITEAPNDEWPHIQFNTQSGQINGNIGCNSIMGSFNYNNKGAMSFGNLGTTMMACPSLDLEQKIILAMPQVTNFRVNEETQELFLMNKNGDNLMVLTKISPVTLMQNRQSF